MVAAGVAACRDIEPVRARQVHARADGGAAAGCGECLLPDTTAAGPCAPQVAACRADPGCDELLQCLIEAGCFEEHDLETQNRCALPCALALGVTSTEEVRVLLVTDIATCGARECSAVCG
jgi:hypothetical protein